MDTIYTLRLSGDSLDVIDAALRAFTRPAATAEDARFIREILADQRAAAGPPLSQPASLSTASPGAATAPAAVIEAPVHERPTSPALTQPVLPAARASEVVSPGLVRAWARTQGYELGDRGRLPTDIVQKYSAVHS